MDAHDADGVTLLLLPMPLPLPLPLLLLTDVCGGLRGVVIQIGKKGDDTSIHIIVETNFQVGVT